MSSIMIFGLSFVRSFSVLAPFLMLMRGLLDTCLICLFLNNRLCQSGSLSKNGGLLTPKLREVKKNALSLVFETVPPETILY